MLLSSNASGEETSTPSPSESDERLRYVFIGLSPVEPIALQGFGGTIEARILQHLSIGFNGAAGPLFAREGATESAYQEVAGHALWYFWGDFNGGLTVGLGSLYHHDRGGARPVWDGQSMKSNLVRSEEASEGDFFGVGPMLGAKVGARVGLTASMQISLMMGNRKRTTPEMAVAGSRLVTWNSYGLRPSLAMSIGWSF